ncbi:MAG: bacteriocin-protection protein [Saprospiraceae bacterium]|nr:bacteriocin-protection protein [Saprospiraceae bacterium]
MTATFFETQIEFRKWLEKHHKKETELIVGYYKVDSGKPSMTWSQSVDQALCFGWIDGVRKSIDKESYSIRFTPRRSTSIWSAVNIKKVEELTKAGLMKPEGLKAFSLKTEDKSKIYSHEKEPIILETNYEKKFRKNKLAWDFFMKQAPSYKKVMTHWIMSAKQEKTRQSRLEKIIIVSGQQKRIV